jgi:hypothetical protein
VTATPRVRLVTLAYGGEPVRTQALYCAWSAVAWTEGLPLSVHVYTDEPAAFASLAGRIEVEPITMERIRAWRGPDDFVHRQKTELVRDVAARFPGDRLLYVDSDTFFTGPVGRAAERIAPGRSVLHVREFHVATHRTSQMRKFRRAMEGVTFRGRPVDLACDMWNAGALGLDPAEFRLLPEWLEMIDAVYPRVPRFFVEQFAISLLLQRETVIAPIDDVLFHYWFQKDEYTEALRRALAELTTLPPDRADERLRAAPIRLPYRKQRSTLAQRLRRIFLGKR